TVSCRRVFKPASSPATKAPSDPRLMVRLDQASSFRSLTAALCLSTARAALGPLADAVKSVQMVPSGLALVPSSASARAQLLSSRAALTKAFAASAIDEQTGRDPYVMLFAPRFTLRAATGPATSSKTMLEAELTPDAYHAELSAVLAASDISDPFAPVATNAPLIEFAAFTSHEVKQCCIGVSSTTPGQDGVTVALLKLAWPLIAARVQALFQACLDLGHPPALSDCSSSHYPQAWGS
ncbi:hypothetical protein KEM56_005137, partial [Ascosphaera pollenicola]